MTDIDDCLAAFAVASWANRPAELAFVHRTIDAYLETVDAHPASQIGALQRLFEACDELRIDSRVAIIIQDEIAERLVGLGSGFSIPSARETRDAADLK